MALTTACLDPNPHLLRRPDLLLWLQKQRLRLPWVWTRKRKFGGSHATSDYSDSSQHRPSRDTNSRQTSIRPNLRAALFDDPCVPVARHPNSPTFRTLHQHISYSSTNCRISLSAYFFPESRKEEVTRSRSCRSFVGCLFVSLELSASLSATFSRAISTCCQLSETPRKPEAPVVNLPCNVKQRRLTPFGILTPSETARSYTMNRPSIASSIRAARREAMARPLHHDSPDTGAYTSPPSSYESPTLQYAFPIAAPLPHRRSLSDSALEPRHPTLLDYQNSRAKEVLLSQESTRQETFLSKLWMFLVSNPDSDLIYWHHTGKYIIIPDDERLLEEFIVKLVSFASNLLNCLSDSSFSTVKVLMAALLAN